MNFTIPLWKIKKMMNKIKDAVVKNESIPTFFNENTGQIILAKNRVIVLNPSIFLEVKTNMDIKTDTGICVPDSFFKFINSIKIKGDEAALDFNLNQGVLKVSLKGENKESTQGEFSVKIINDILDILPNPSGKNDIYPLPNVFHTGISFCTKFVDKSKTPNPYSFVWCTKDQIVSSDQNRISKVDLNEEFPLEFCLSPLAIKVLKEKEIYEYTVDSKGYAFFYGSDVTVGVRQFNSESIVSILENVEDLETPEHVILPTELYEKIPEIKSNVDKKSNPFIEIKIKDAQMEVLAASGSTKKKADVLISVEGVEHEEDLEFGIPYTHFEDLISFSVAFFVDKECTLVLSQTKNEEDEVFSLYTGLPRKVS